jgi:hypothetical protein
MEHLLLDAPEEHELPPEIRGLARFQTPASEAAEGPKER